MKRGYKHWTGSEVKFLAENLSLTDKQIAQKLNRPATSIRSARVRLLQDEENVKRRKAWTGSELNFIRQNMHLTDEQIAEALQRTPAAVSTIRSVNGILRRSVGTA